MCFLTVFMAKFSRHITSIGIQILTRKKEGLWRQFFQLFQICVKNWMEMFKIQSFLPYVISKRLWKLIYPLLNGVKIIMIYIVNYREYTMVSCTKMKNIGVLFNYHSFQCTLKDTLTALSWTPMARPESLIYIPNRDNKHRRPFHIGVPMWAKVVLILCSKLQENASLDV